MPYGYGSMIVTGGTSYDGGNPIQQTFYSIAGDIYTRNKWAGTWTTWKVIYNENILSNSTILSPLASALGDVAIEVSNLNTNTICGVTLAVPGNATGNPVGGNMLGIQLSGTVAGTTTHRQILFRGANGEIYYRHGEGISSITWGSWYKFAGTLVTQ